MKIQHFFALGLISILLVACSGADIPTATSADLSTPTMPNVAATLIPPTVATAGITSSPAPVVTPVTTIVSRKQPNIIVILTDDLDEASLAYMPKLKSLIADQGVTFKNFLISMSLCCPSRTAILRGQYDHNTQILGNTPPSGGFQKFFQLGEEKSTVNVWLQNTGYRTMLAGKYLNGYPDRSNLMYIPPGWNEWYSAMKGNAYSEYNYTLNENGKQVAYGNKPEDYGTDVYARKAIDFIQRTSKDGKPFFVYLTPYAPHGPATPAPRHDKLFPDAKAPRTPNYNEADVSDKPNYIRLRPGLTAREMTRIDEDYRKRLQSLQAVDDMIESLVNTLKQTGQLDNTYIFFTSDNGFHLGNHRQLTGKVAPYAEEIRVQMMVRGPGIPAGKTVEHLTGNIDLAPTWAELGGAKMPDFVDGRSLVSLWGANPPSLGSWRQLFLIENGMITAQVETRQARLVLNTPPELLEPPDADDEVLEATPSAVQRARLGIPAFRGFYTSDYSYVEYITGEKELYDLKKDPYQLQNLASKADPGLLAQFSARLKSMTTCAAENCRSTERAAFK
jgi:N-acetylglucosamine-6-sulfatase